MSWIRSLAAGLFLFGLVGCASRTPVAPVAETAAPATATPLAWSVLSAMPQPPPGQRLAYGPAPQQFGELRLPAGAGPHPVVVLIHGGCWLSQFSLEYFSHLAAGLTDAGYATWSIEYRRIGDPDGGWPGTFLDAGAAIDHLQTLGDSQPLDLARVAVLGHSAGGQMALWAATRDDPHGPLPADAPLPVRAVVGIAPITDLAAYRVGPEHSCHAAVDRGMGGTPATVGDRYAAVSPMDRLPLRVPVLLISGGQDEIVAPESVEAFAHAAMLENDPVQLRVVAGEGHFDAVLPGGRSWDMLLDFLGASLR